MSLRLVDRDRHIHVLQYLSTSTIIARVRCLLPLLLRYGSLYRTCILSLDIEAQRKNIIFMIPWVEQLTEQQRATRHLYSDQKIYERFEVKIDLTLKYGKLV